MAVNHDRIVTPYTDPDRWNDDEKALFDAGKCPWVTAYGAPYTRFCGQPSRPGASFGHCGEHEAELLEAFFPDGTPRR